MLINQSQIVKQPYLLIIDNAPVSDEFRDYFYQFGFNIKQQDQIKQVEIPINPPYAILIHFSLFLSDIKTMRLSTLYNVPIIVLSEVAHEEICVNMLENGADDFMIKPIHLRELHARISAVHRRVSRDTELEKEMFLFANCRLYPNSRQLFKGQEEQLLSPKEYDLLLAFVRQPLQILSREFLLQTTKNEDLNPLNRRIDVQISRLRQKVEADANHPILIKTVHNKGYLLATPVTSRSLPK